MWLLNTTTLRLCEFLSHPPPYAILSHTWGKEEITFQEIGTPDAEGKRGYKKITQCCALAKLEGLKYAWVDTCCIDKRSSAELSEAINSMFRWYSEAHICYAYLEDVDLLSRWASALWDVHFQSSRWFKRGWTLQELLAPVHVTFFDSHWFEIGTKLSLLDILSRKTRIPHQALLDPSNIYLHSVAERLFWAASRETTREEDVAYCLLGIFGVNMPLLYGEDNSNTGEPVSILADSPALFQGGIIDLNNKADPHQVPTPITVTNLGLSMSLPIASFRDMAIPDREMKPGVDDESFIAILNCLHQGQRVGIAVLRHNGMTHWSRYGCSQFELIDPNHASKIAAENVLMSIEERKHSTPIAVFCILISWKPNKFPASLSDAVRVGKFEGEKLLETKEVAFPEEEPTWDTELGIRYDCHSMEYRYAALLLPGRTWLGIAQTRGRSFSHPMLRRGRRSHLVLRSHPSAAATTGCCSNTHVEEVQRIFFTIRAA
ncbi:hypothetical protein LTR67_007936 [Exophiala xenobiotica]